MVPRQFVVPSSLGATFFMKGRNDFMKSMTGDQIRQTWLDFFASKGHMIEPGASLIPHNDPTLLWINSGVAALKKYFDGSEKPRSKRIVNAQKSIRTNDIENVGMTARHHTFFEMLGNFSIGDYFRQEAIEWGFELLTSPKWFGFHLDQLYMTVHPTDDATRKIWMKLGVKEDHIIDCEGNFWEIGEGPCGPNTEIFVDRGDQFDPNKLGLQMLQNDIENDRYIEIWNIVFSQFNSKSGLLRDQYPELPQKNIDTGAGLERLACVLQGVETNFETDLFYPIILATAQHAKVPYEGNAKHSYRVIADHVRTCTFALADGALFSNEGRGYVLRRLLRRAIRHGRKLGIESAILDELVQVCADTMKGFYPYLLDRVEHIRRLIRAEEARFQRTLQSGEQLLMEYLSEIKTNQLPGDLAFKLYDTYGFPLELTMEIAQEQKFHVDVEGFEKEMEAQKQRARSARSEEQSMARQSADLLQFTIPSAFLYEPQPQMATIIGLFVNGKQVEILEEEGDVILDHTIFYAESGGQVADRGVMHVQGLTIPVLDVKKAPNHQHLHRIDPQGLSLQPGDEVMLEVDQSLRSRTMRHHSAAHLLQQALREVLGTHIEQAGSYVDDERLRFDFTHFEKIKREQLEAIERRVNQIIDQGLPASIEVMSLEAAKSKGAIALFGEKYGEEVRVVEFGDYSMELCGGCHVANTKDIGVFVIDFEESISSGVRRIQASCGIHGYEIMKKREAIAESAAKSLGALSISEIDDRLHSLQKQYEQVKSELSILKQRFAKTKASELYATADQSRGYPLVLSVLSDFDKESFSQLAEELRIKNDAIVVFLINQTPERISLIAAAGPQQVKQGLHCGKLVKMAAEKVGGSGGGRPELAQAGGKQADNIPDAIHFVLNYLKKE